MLQDRAASEENLTRFIERVRRDREVWGLISQSGEWAFCPSHEKKDTQVLVFWSDRAYAARHAKEDWSEYEPKALGLDLFLGRFLQVMHEDGLLVGPNWDAHLCGLELTAFELAKRLEEEANQAAQTTPGLRPSVSDL
jgi:hypothetical protein